MIRESYYNEVLKPLLVYQKFLKQKRGLTSKILLYFLNKEIRRKEKEFYKLFSDKYIK